MDQAVTPKLEAHYSTGGLLGRLMLYLGVAAAFCFFLASYRHWNWLVIGTGAVIAMLAAMALPLLYRLLMARGDVVVSVDATGFRDIRLSPTVIPWRAVQSVSPHRLPKTTKPTGVALVLDAAFKRSFTMRPGARLWHWANLPFRQLVYVDTGTLDVDSDELARVAGSYLATRA